MECDTFIHRVKGGDYTLYDKNGVKVDPRDLAYTDGTFDDMKEKKFGNKMNQIVLIGLGGFLIIFQKIDLGYWLMM